MFNYITKAIPVCTLILMVHFGAIGQRNEPCATVEYNEKIRQRNPNFESKEQFEEWIKRKKAAKKRYKIFGAPYTVPVVFHVIHNGEAEGVGANIPDKDIYAQVESLNKDFQRRNRDAEDTPSDFKDLAGSMEITFVLAKQTPEGRVSNGIVRVKGNKKSWDYEDDSFKLLSHWPTKDYFNIWVTNLSRTESGGFLLGYATFPMSDQLDGLDGLENSASMLGIKDGVVLHYRTIRSHSFRGLTHETGHFLGLRHIWGDESFCLGNDYVDDTPPQSSATTDTDGCPQHPYPDCDGKRMFQNYMDYSPNWCMNLFTKKQVDRMEIIINNSPRRATLSSSRGLRDPVQKTNNLAINRIISPKKAFCNVGTIIPHIQVANYGSKQVSSARIQLRIDEKIVQTKNVVFSPSLGQYEADTIFYDAITPATAGAYQYTFEVLQVNDTTDDVPENDALSVQLTVPYSADFPFLETFDNQAMRWQIQNFDRDITWRPVAVYNDGFGGKSMSLNFYDYKALNATDNLISPVIRLPASNRSSSLPTLKFDWFYPTFTFDGRDSLQVILIDGCDTDLSNGVKVFSGSGKQLVTTTKNALTPSKISQWKTVSIPLRSSVTDMKNPRVVFSGINGYSSSLYLDNVSVSYPHETDLLYSAYGNTTSNDIKITFNLTKRELVYLQVYTVGGTILFEGTIPDALDQTYTIPIKQIRTGIYLLRLQFNNRTEVTRIFVGS